MEKIYNLFTDLFEVKDLTDNRLETFTADHVERIKANNPSGVFDALIADTQTVLAEFHHSRQRQQGSIGNFKADTLSKSRARETFTIFIRQQEGTVRGKFGKGSTPYLHFFPDGLTAFDRATAMGYELLVKNIVARATQYETDLGSGLKTQATALAHAYITAEEDQVEKIGQVSNTRSEADTDHSALTRQLTYNALVIATHFLLQTQKSKVYFNTSLLFAPHRKRVHKGKPEAGATQTVAAIHFEAGKFIWMKNKGATALIFQMYLQQQAVGNRFTLQPGEELHKRMDAFFSHADELRVTNTGTETGMYQVKEVA